MAGRPLRNAMIDVLRKRTNEWFGDEMHSALDFVLEWTMEGRSIQHLIYELTREIETGVFDLPQPTPVLSRTMLMHYLESLEPGNNIVANRLSRARSIGAHSMVENANVALDADDADKLDRDTLNVLDRRLAAKERLAAAWNRADFGKSAGVSVAVSFGDLHLAALQAQARAVIVAGAEPETDDATWHLESGADEEKTQESGQDAGTQIATLGKTP